MILKHCDSYALTVIWNSQTSCQFFKLHDVHLFHYNIIILQRSPSARSYNEQILKYD
jgi:hypothetical protein